MPGPFGLEIDWSSGPSKPQDPDIVSAVQHFADRKECNAIAVNITDKHFWFKRFTVVDEIHLRKVTSCHHMSWYVDNGEWCCLPETDVPFNDQFDMGSRKMSFDLWDSAFVEAMLVLADRKGYQGVMLQKPHGVHFKRFPIQSFRPAEQHAEDHQAESWTRTWFSHLDLPVQLLRKTIVEEDCEDPLPKFTAGDVHSAAESMAKTIRAMQESADIFHEGHPPRPAHIRTTLASCSDEQIQTRLELARESSRRLALLFGDHREEFAIDASTQWGFRVTGSDLSVEARSTIERWLKYIEAFDEPQRLMHEKMEEDGASSAGMVSEILRGLLGPHQKGLEGTDGLEGATAADKWLEPALGALAEDAGMELAGSPEKMLALARISQGLADAFALQALQRSEVRKQFDQKIKALQHFAETLALLPPVLNMYTFTHLGEMAMDNSVLKEFTSREEATVAHRSLEAFRDAAVREQAVREAREGMMASPAGSAPSEGSSRASWQIP